ncbi:hypothetical protein BDP27DRAFT_1447140 [Rhodocollybia butyracea]|uniref:Uncharacterized protein n=1 Tax=Rhodocollybia butyracea TaxID=206335 RepID=A0A9P5U9R6_9AGAR|nr:hypothetical protein BDP27DRAFT_1447140 [Rhodocollybia butyracea]
MTLIIPCSFPAEALPELSWSFLLKLVQTNASQKNLFFIGVPSGVLPISGDISPTIASHLIWSATGTLQIKLGKFMDLCFAGKLNIRTYGAELAKVFVTAKSFMLFLLHAYLGRKPAFLVIECIFACAQLLHAQSSQHPAWYLEDAHTAARAAGVMPSSNIMLMFDDGYCETAWLVHCATQATQPTSKIHPSAVQEQVEHQSKLQNELNALFSFNTPSAPGGVSAVAGPFQDQPAPGQDQVDLDQDQGDPGQDQVDLDQDQGVKSQTKRLVNQLYLTNTSDLTDSGAAR